MTDVFVEDAEPSFEKDYRVELKVKNNRMWTAMRRAGFQTALALSQAANVSPSRLGEYLNLKLAPMTYGRGLRTGAVEIWRSDVLRIASILKMLPEDLFPPQHLRKALRKNTASIDMTLDEVERIPGSVVMMIEHETPETKMMGDDVRRAIGKSLGRLGPREQRVLVMRYGLDDGEPKTYEQVAAAMGVTGERSRQIERKALRKLRSTTAGDAIKAAMPPLRTSRIFAANA